MKAFSFIVASTLSTSTSSFEAPDVNDPQLNKLAIDAFQKIEAYVQVELSTTLEDYKAIETMNKVTTAKYADLVNLSGSVKDTVQELNMKYRDLQPYLDQLDAIEVSVDNLEKAAKHLDQYARQLEHKFRSLERR